jgi:hypothetical protein
MGYCLYVFTSDFGDDPEPEELAECDVGDFCDLAFFHSSINCNLGAGRYPTLMRLLDSDCGFPASEVRAVEREIQEIAAEFRELPSERMKNAFRRAQEARAAEAHAQEARAAEVRTVASSLCKCAQEHILDPLNNMTSFQYSLDDIGPTGRKLREIAVEFHKLPSDGTIEALSGASEDGVGAGSLYDCFQDANGAKLFECLLKLCAVAIERGRPIISQ